LVPPASDAEACAASCISGRVDPLRYPADFPKETGAVVPLCAFDGSTARTSGKCKANECCTGADGAGVAPVAGECPLVFSVGSDGDGMSIAIVDGVKALLTGTIMDVNARVRRDDGELSETGIDTACFIKSVVPQSYENSAGCASAPAKADLTTELPGLDGWKGVAPGTKVFFTVTAQNTSCAPPLTEAKVYEAYIDVMGDGFTVLDTQTVTILVPPRSVQ
ncbi:MAG: hypothetical protein V2A73_00145, partial [Pseudomonadota bacterium]